MIVREAKPTDIDAILELGARLLRESPVLPPHHPLKARKALAFFISSARNCLYVAEKNGEVVGFIAGAIDEFWWSTIKYASDVAFFVAPEHKGAGLPLVKAFMRWVDKFPRVRYVSMGISSGLDSMDRTGLMYERLGFAKAGGIYTMKIEADKL